MSDKLENVKAGDILAHLYGYGSKENLVKVSRVTQAQVFISFGFNQREKPYWRRDGKVVGGTDRYSTDRLRVPTPEEIERIRAEATRARQIHGLMGFNFNRLSDAGLTEILAIIAREEGARKEGE